MTDEERMKLIGITDNLHRLIGSVSVNDPAKLRSHFRQMRNVLNSGINLTEKISQRA